MVVGPWIDGKGQAVMAPLSVKIFVGFCAALLAGNLVFSLKTRKWATPWGPITPDQRPILFWIGVAARGALFALFLMFAILLILSN